MPVFLLCLCFLLTVGVVLWAVRRTKAARAVPDFVEPVRLDNPISLAEVLPFCEEGQLVCRPRFLHLAFTETFEVNDDQLGPFVGFAKADAQHNAVLLVTDLQGLLRGRIDCQQQLYEVLIASRRAACYGMVRKLEDGYQGEVCIRVR